MARAEQTRHGRKASTRPTGAAGQAGLQGVGPDPPGVRGRRPAGQNLWPMGESQLRGPVSGLPLIPSQSPRSSSPTVLLSLREGGSFSKLHTCFNIIGGSLK